MNVNGARPELPKGTIQGIVNTITGNNDDDSGGQIEGDLPDTQDEVVNEVKLLCADQCEQLMLAEMFHICWLSCKEAVLAELHE